MAEQFIKCSHLRAHPDHRAEAAIPLGEVAEGEPAGVLLCAGCWLAVKGAAIAEVAQEAIKQVVLTGGLAALGMTGGDG